MEREDERMLLVLLVLVLVVLVVGGGGGSGKRICNNTSAGANLKSRMFRSCFCMETRSRAPSRLPAVSAARLGRAQPGNGANKQAIVTASRVCIRTANIVCGRFASAENVTAANYERQGEKTERRVTQREERSP